MGTTLKRKDVDKALRTKGFEVDEESDHTQYFLHVDGEETLVHTKVSRGTGYKDLGAPLVKLMAEQCKLTKAEFVQFVECKIGKEEYVVLLREKGVAF